MTVYGPRCNVHPDRTGGILMDAARHDGWCP